MNPLLLLGWQRWALYGGVLAVLLGAAWFHGYTRGELELGEYKAKQAAAAVVIVTKRGAVTEKIVTRYVKVMQETGNSAAGIRNEVIRYVEKNPGSCLDPRWGRLHDYAAANAIPPAESVADGARGAPTAAASIATVTDNYRAHHECVDRLDALQAWIKEQAAVD